MTYMMYQNILQYQHKVSHTHLDICAELKVKVGVREQDDSVAQNTGLVWSRKLQVLNQNCLETRDALWEHGNLFALLVYHV